MPGLRFAPEGPALLGPDVGGLEAVLVAPAPDRGARPRLLGSAWRAPDGPRRSGWPGPDGSIEGLETALAPRRAVLIAPSLALAAGLRRAAPGLGTRCLVLGKGLAAGLARALATDFGARVSDGADLPEPLRPALVIVTEPSGDGMQAGLTRVEDGGSVLALGDPGDLPPLDFYPHVHRRGLRLDIVPWRPDRDEAARLWERGRARLERLLGAFEPEANPVVPLLREGAGWRLAPAASGWSIQVPAP